MYPIYKYLKMNIILLDYFFLIQMFNVALWKSPSVDLISDFQLQIEILWRIYFIFSFWLKIIFMKNFSWKFEKEKFENRVNSLENLDWKLKIRNEGHRTRFSNGAKIIYIKKKWSFITDELKYYKINKYHIKNTYCRNCIWKVIKKKTK